MAILLFGFVFFCLLGSEDGFSNHFSLTHTWILENQELVEEKTERIKTLMGVSTFYS